MTDPRPNPELPEERVIASDLISEVADETAKPLLRFAVHGFTGLALFIVISLIAYLLVLWVNYLHAAGFDGWKHTVLLVVEGFVLVLDAALFVTFLLRISWRLLRDLW